MNNIELTQNPIIIPLDDPTFDVLQIEIEFPTSFIEFKPALEGDGVDFDRVTLSVTLSYKYTEEMEEEYFNPYMDDIFFDVTIPVNWVADPVNYLTTISEYVGGSSLGRELRDLGYGGNVYREIEDYLDSRFDEDELTL